MAPAATPSFHIPGQILLPFNVKTLSSRHQASAPMAEDPLHKLHTHVSLHSVQSLIFTVSISLVRHKPKGAHCSLL